jgi:hypothetical protein
MRNEAVLKESFSLLLHPQWRRIENNKQNLSGFYCYFIDNK